MSEVVLTPAELHLAAMVGAARQIQALRERRPDRHGADPAEGWMLHIEGAAGEMAAARALDRYWAAPIGTYRLGGDVGEVQVRTRARHEYGLIVRADDRNSDAFVLVTGRAPRFRVHGWMSGSEAKQERWLREHGGRPPAYFVPREALHELADLL